MTGCVVTGDHDCMFLFITQGGIFRVVSKTDLAKHTGMSKEALKVLTMIPMASDPPSQGTIDAYCSFLSGLPGFQSVCVYQIDESSGSLDNDWLYSWILEAYYNAESTDATALLKDIVTSSVFTTKWQVCVHKDDMQLQPK